jgi:hypothetical protein
LTTFTGAGFCFFAATVFTGAPLTFELVAAEIFFAGTCLATLFTALVALVVDAV